MGKINKKVKDDEGNEYEIEFDEDDDDDDEEDEDEENIYITEKDIRWLKDKRKLEGSQSSGGQTDKKLKSKSGIAVKKRKPSGPQNNKSRVKKLSLR